MPAHLRNDLVELLREKATRIAPEVAPEQVTPERDVTELGMDSMQLMEFVAEIEDALEIRIPERELIQVRTVSHLLLVIERHSTGG